MPDLGNELINVMVGAQTNPSLGEPRAILLSNEEMQILRLIAQGLTTKAIAEKLEVNFKTAACRQSRLILKLKANSRLSAVDSALRDGMIAA